MTKTRRWSILGSSDATFDLFRPLACSAGALLLLLTLGLAAPVSMTIGLLALLILTAAAAVSRVGIVMATIIALPYFYHPIGVGTQEFAASELLLVAAVAGSGVRVVGDIGAGSATASSFLRDVRAALGSHLIQFMVVLVVAGLITILTAYDPAARDASLREWRWSLAAPLVLLTLITMFVRHRTARGLLAASLIAAGTIAAAHALLDIVTGGGVSADDVRRLAGPLPHPNALALFLVRPFVLAAAIFVLSTRWRPHLAIPLAVSGLALFGTFSRGAMIAVVVAAAIVALRVPLRLQLALGGATAAAMAVTAVIAGDRMRNAFEGGSVSLRLDIWSSAAAMIRDRPVLGYGPDQFLYAYAPRYIQPTAWDERFTSHAHNLIADSWIRLGVVGAIAALVVLWVVVRRLISVSRESRQVRTLEQASLIALGAVLVHGMIDNAVYAHDLSMSAWLLAWLAFPEWSGQPERLDTDG